jgi:N12 class adenine-specific DNA methylase
MRKVDCSLISVWCGLTIKVTDAAEPPSADRLVSKMTRIAGLPQTASERAFDMYLKVRHVQSLNGGGGVVFATGTPIANSMAEMFTMQR